MAGKVFRGIKRFGTGMASKRIEANTEAAFERNASRKVRRIKKETPHDADAIYKAGLEADRHRREKNRLLKPNKK